MINFSLITAAVETMLSSGLGSTYTVLRNARRNNDPEVAARNAGWVNVQRGGNSYRPAGIGARKWEAKPVIRVEVQVASRASGADAEDKLQAAELAVLQVFENDPKLGGTVGHVTGFDIDYRYNDEVQVWHHAVIISVIAEVRG